MTDRNDLKRLVRARMAKTGESYSTARRYFLFARNPVVPTNIEPSLEEQLSGTWRDAAAEVIFKFNSLPPSAGSRSLTVDLPSKGAYGLPAEFHSPSGRDVQIAVNTVGATFTGTLDYGRLNGHWRQGRAESELALSRHSTSTSITMNDGVFAELQGTWAGTLRHEDGSHLRVNIHMQGVAQSIDVIAESLDQNSAPIPAFAVMQYGHEIEISFLMAAAPNGRFRGRLSGGLAGSWHQNERIVDAVFHKM